MMASDYVVILSHLSDEERQNFHHQSGDDRHNRSKPFSERVAAEIIHNATYKE